MENKLATQKQHLPTLQVREDNTSIAIIQINNRELKVDGTNLMKIRRDTLNIGAVAKDILNAVLAKEIMDSFAFFNVQYSTNMIDLIIDDIKELYKLHSLIEIIQAIRDGRRAQEKIFGKFSPHHVMEWIKLFDGKTFIPKEDFTKRLMIENDKSDKYDYGNSQDAEVTKVYKKLAENFKPKKEFSKAEMGKALSQDPIYLKHLESQKKLKEEFKNK